MTFKDFITSFKSLWGITTAAVTAGPLSLSLFSKLSPPWPKTGVGALGTLLCFISIVIAYGINELLEITYLSPRITRIIRLTLGALFLFISAASIVLYVNWFSASVIEIEQVVQGETQTLRWVAGDELLPHLRSFETTDRIRLFQESGFSPEEVWSTHSLKIARLRLLLSFLSGCSFLVFGTALFAIESKGKDVSVESNASATD